MKQFLLILAMCVTVGTATVIAAPLLTSPNNSASRGTVDASLEATKGHPANALYASADVEYVQSLVDLVRGASAVVVAETVGEALFTPRSEDGTFGDYVQEIRVADVYKGAGEERLRVVRFGLSPEARARAVQTQPDELTTGFPSGRAVFFLGPSAEDGLLRVVGYSQGILSVSQSGIVTDVGERGFTELEGRSLEEIRSTVARLAQAPTVPLERLAISSVAWMDVERDLEFVWRAAR